MEDSSDDEEIIVQARNPVKFTGSVNRERSSGKKGLWTAEEDEKLVALYRLEGSQRWPQIASQIPGRTYKQCCERWHNHVNPEIRKGPWTEEEYRIILREHYKSGTNWSDIARHLPGRTGFAVKSHWKGSMRRKVEGYLKSVNKIDPKKEFKSYNDFKNHFMEMAITEQDINDILCFLRKNINASLRRLAKNKKDAGEIEGKPNVAPPVATQLAIQQTSIPLAKKVRLNDTETEGGDLLNNAMVDSSDSEGEGNEVLQLLSSHNGPDHQHELVQQQPQQPQQPQEQYQQNVAQIQEPSLPVSTPITGKTPTKSVKRDRVLWSAYEDSLLREGVKKYPNLDWLLISIDVPQKTPMNCRNRWTKFLDPNLRKGHWTEEEDNKLAQLIYELGPKYTEIAASLPGRTGKQCRNRWLVSLDPSISKTPYSAEEYRTIVSEKHRQGNNWKAIAALLNNNRIGSAVGNHFHSYMQRKISQYMNAVGHEINTPHDEGEQEFDNRFKSLVLTDSVLDAIVFKLMHDGSGSEGSNMRNSNRTVANTVVRQQPPPLPTVQSSVMPAVPTAAVHSVQKVYPQQQLQQQHQHPHPYLQYQQEQYQQQLQQHQLQQQQQQQSMYIMSNQMAAFHHSMQQQQVQTPPITSALQVSNFVQDNIHSVAAVPVVSHDLIPAQYTTNVGHVIESGTNALDEVGFHGDNAHEATLLKKRKIAVSGITEV